MPLCTKATVDTRLQLISIISVKGGIEVAVMNLLSEIKDKNMKKLVIAQLGRLSKNIV